SDDIADGGSVQDFQTYLGIARACCEGNHAAPKRTALDKINSRGLLRGPTKFPHFDTVRMAYGLVRRLLEPRLFNQGPFGLCGPTAIAVDLAKREPVAFIDFALDLLITGTGRVFQYEVTPNERVLTYKCTDIPPTDWVILATIRNCDDLLDKEKASQ